MGSICYSGEHLLYYREQLLHYAKQLSYHREVGKICSFMGSIRCTTGHNFRIMGKNFRVWGKSVLIQETVFVSHGWLGFVPFPVKLRECAQIVHSSFVFSGCVFGTKTGG